MLPSIAGNDQLLTAHGLRLSLSRTIQPGGMPKNTSGYPIVGSVSHSKEVVPCPVRGFWFCLRAIIPLVFASHALAKRHANIDCPGTRVSLILQGSHRTAFPLSLKDVLL